MLFNLNDILNLEYNLSIYLYYTLMNVKTLRHEFNTNPCGVDRLAAEHFLHADDLISIILSILFNVFMNHVLPDIFLVYPRDQYLGRSYTACILNLCRTSFDVLVGCIIHMMMIHTSTL